MKAGQTNSVATKIPKRIRFLWCLALSAVIHLPSASAQTPGTFTYEAETEISNSRLLTVEQYEFVRTMLPTQYYDQVDFWINVVRSGREYEYEAYLWADRGPLRATQVFLTFPDGRTRVGILDEDRDFKFSGWTNSARSLADLKAALPPGIYHLLAVFEDGMGTNYTAQLPDYTDSSFPSFVPGVLTWNGSSNATLNLRWDTVPQVDEFEVGAGLLTSGSSLFKSGNLYPSHPSTLTTPLYGILVNTNYCYVGVQAERGVITGAFNFEFSSQTTFFLLPPLMKHESRSVGAPFRFDVLGGDGTSYLVEGSTNLFNWTPLGVSTIHSNGCFHFTDEMATGIPQRFYRAVWSPAP